MKSKVSPGLIDDVVSYSTVRHSDFRGHLTKPFSKEEQKTALFDVREVFFSQSHRGVLRGMHLQVGPHINERIVVLVSGRILDVTLDLRSQSKTFLNYQVIDLKVPELTCAYIPAGVAHGFMALESSTTLYLSSKAHSAEYDVGIDALSFGFDWASESFIRSERDKHLPSLEEWLRDAPHAP